MKKITEKEFKQNINAVLEQATDEPIQIELLNNTLYLSTIRNTNILDNEWVKEFMAIPEEFRINPFEISDSGRSEEHTSELQSRPHLVCRLLLEKKNNLQRHHPAFVTRIIDIPRASPPTSEIDHERGPIKL